LDRWCHAPSTTLEQAAECAWTGSTQEYHAEVRGELRQRLNYWAAWAAMALYTAVADVASAALPEGLSFWKRVLPLNLLECLVWGLLGLGLTAVARRYPLERLSIRDWKAWLVHLLGSGLATSLGLVLTWLIAVTFLSSSDQARVLAAPVKSLKAFAGMYYQLLLLLNWIVLGAHYGWRLNERFQQREVEAARLASQLAEAQNQALRMQLQPHFLFNTLNSISALVHSEPDAADRMISRLADLLRMTLELKGRQEIPLREELALTESYLAIEAIRFQDRLRVHYEVEPACRAALVPAFLLQPLVENAIKHGASRLARPSTIEIRIRRSQEWLDLEVTDDGRGLDGGGREGLGTANTAARLRLLYRDRQRFVLQGAPGQGATAQIRIPYSAAPA
jgi:two-component system, LytTR family, sensor kinase